MHRFQERVPCDVDLWGWLPGVGGCIEPVEDGGSVDDFEIVDAGRGKDGDSALGADDEDTGQGVKSYKGRVEEEGSEPLGGFAAARRADGEIV